jgi:hypothetical protein
MNFGPATGGYVFSFFVVWAAGRYDFDYTMLSLGEHCNVFFEGCMRVGRPT